jgi:plastocyanin
MKYKILVIVAALVLVAAACNKGSNPADNSNGTDQTDNSPTLSGNVEIDITSSGFSPSHVKVTSGTIVTFKNTGTKLHWPASDPHPTHTDLPGFDSLKGLANGETYSFTFTKAGTWGLHDHLIPTLTADVTVVQ